MTLTDLHESLARMPAQLPLVIRTDQGEIGGGYHVTEYKTAEITSIDCGGRMATWREASVQLLDGYTDIHMLTGKFTAILKTSLARLDGLGDVPFFVEFAHKNKGLNRYEVSAPSQTAACVEIRMAPAQATCKPASRPAPDAGCCSPGGKPACC